MQIKRLLLKTNEYVIQQIKIPSITIVVYETFFKTKLPPPVVHFLYIHVSNVNQKNEHNLLAIVGNFATNVYCFKTFKSVNPLIRLNQKNHILKFDGK